MVKNPIKLVAYPSMTTAPPAPLTNPMYASMFSCSQNVQLLRQAVASLWPPLRMELDKTLPHGLRWARFENIIVVQNLPSLPENEGENNACLLWLVLEWHRNATERQAIDRRWHPFKAQIVPNIFPKFGELWSINGWDCVEHIRPAPCKFSHFRHSHEISTRLWHMFGSHSF